MKAAVSIIGAVFLLISCVAGEKNSTSTPKVFASCPKKHPMAQKGALCVGSLKCEYAVTNKHGKTALKSCLCLPEGKFECSKPFSTKGVVLKKPAENSTKTEKPGLRGTNSTKIDKPEKNSTKIDKPEKNSTKIDQPEKNFTKIDKPEKNSTKIDKPEKNFTKIEKPEKNSTKIGKPEKNSTKIGKPETNSTKSDKPPTGAKPSKNGVSTDKAGGSVTQPQWSGYGNIDVVDSPASVEKAFALSTTTAVTDPLPVPQPVQDSFAFTGSGKCKYCQDGQECPAKVPKAGSFTSLTGIKCEFGKVECCGQTGPKKVCAEVGGKWLCYADDFCKRIGCTV
jgi:hypothetical protein